MENALRDAPLFYCVTDEKGKILSANRTLTCRLGLEEAALAGRSLQGLFSLPSRIFWETHLFPLLKMQGWADEIYVALEGVEGPLPVLINARIDEGGHTVLAGMEVRQRSRFEEELISARKRAEEALQQNTLLEAARAELQAGMEELDARMEQVRVQHEELIQFNRVISHDLQEPIRKLAYLSDLLQTNNASLETVLPKFNRSAEAIRTLLAGLQRYVWTESGIKDRTTVDLSGVLQAAKQETAAAFPGQELQLEADALPPVHAHPQGMQVLFSELLANAVRFSGAGPARVRIRSTPLKENAAPELSGRYRVEDFVLVEVEDEGIGFDAGNAQQVFDLFRTLHPNSGRGIGLALCKKIMEQHGGRISVRSRSGAGTTFSLLLPIGTSYKN